MFFFLNFKTYPELYPVPLTTTFVPRIYGFKIFQKKGSKYQTNSKQTKEITFYNEEQLKKMKGLFNFFSNI